MTARGNRLVAPARWESAKALVIPAAEYNGGRVQNRKLPLSDNNAGVRPNSRAASTKAGARSR